MATQGTIETGLYQQALSACGLKPYIPKNFDSERNHVSDLRADKGREIL